VALVGTVKSLCLRRALRGFCLTFAAGLLALPTAAFAQSLLLGPAPRRIKSRPQYDPALPTGAERAPQLAIAELGLSRFCSGSRPVCVAWDPRDKTTLVLEALSQLEFAYDHLVLVLGLPVPRKADDGQPLTWQLAPQDEPLKVQLLPNLSAGFDTASVVCRSGTRKELERSAHLCVGEAIAARLDPAETPEVRRAYALQLWWSVGSFYDSDIMGLAQAQSNPQAALLARDNISSAPATALFFDYLDHKFGSESMAALPTGLISLSAQHTPPEAWRFINQPDVADVLRATFDDNLSVWAHRLVDFAIARETLTDGIGALAPLAAIGAMAHPRIDWVIKASTLPRRVAPALPLQPWGSVYVQIDLDIPTEKLELGIKTEWEAPVPMVWQIVKLDEAGKEMGRIDIAFEQRGTESERRLVALEATRSLLIVGTNLGGVDLAHPFDPDHEPFEPHSCTVYVGRM